MAAVRRLSILAVFGVVLGAAVLGAPSDSGAVAQPILVRESLAEGLEWPVSFAFAADGRIFFNERLTGRIRVIEGGQVVEASVANVTVVTQGEQGLLGLALDPAFPVRPWIYIYHTYANASLGRDANRVVRFWAGAGGPRSEVLLDPIPAALIHNGGQLGFAPDGTLFVTTGDAGVPGAAQDNRSLSGKVLRIHADGTVPPDNPIAGSPVYSLGHRNVFGLAFHPLTGRAYVSENGPTSDDEVNALAAGRNYGWPLVTGAAGDPRFVDPVVTYPEVIAPTGLAFYTGAEAIDWWGNLFLGDWNRGVLQRIVLAPPAFDRVLANETIDDVGPGGILDLEMSPDLRLHFSTPEGIYRIRILSPDGGNATDIGAFVFVAVVAGAAGSFALLALLARFRRKRPPSDVRPPH